MLAQDAAKAASAADELGWQMAIHAYTFRKFSIFECIDKTAAAGSDKKKKAESKAMHDVSWGTGAGNVKAQMAELKRQHFHGAFCVEYEYHGDNSVTEIAECVKLFNATCEELAKQP
jgi:hypothetical protein